ncbi:ArsR/SmtB family transcription factor [Defluviimonas sp. SAOS-178_SWC]|uniref:ArsR/SmtB family transcription factor n=1 Tax=Defluviimonas sp. SAOS-178_SWC TaxID=3121287 RepID=UPI0032214B07
MVIDAESTILALRALSNPRRLTIMQWLTDPVQHFPPQRDGDLVEDGVCVGFITKKIELSQPAVTAHMQVLADAGLVTSKRIKNWVFYKVDRIRLAAVMADLNVAFPDDASATGKQARFVGDGSDTGRGE